ncbi:cell wall-binding repeat-containing protein, partial [Peptostreptococcus faecalis]|uniref:cell wall-binding repeat-containing protein n=1 Tax=Peptostreptococcus faecalis TaxID=2045015 RepID=UPI0015E14011
MYTKRILRKGLSFTFAMAMAISMVSPINYSYAVENNIELNEKLSKSNVKKAGEGMSVEVTNLDSLKAAILDLSVTEIVLANDIYVDSTLDINRAVTIRGKKQDTKLMVEDSVNATNILNLNADADEVVLENFTIDGGDKHTSIYSYHYSKKINLALKGMIINNSKHLEGDNGGAINITGFGNIYIENSKFEGNDASEAFGGAIYLSAFNGEIDLKINGSEFRNNKSELGGVISFIGKGSILVDNSKIINNYATYLGAAMYVSANPEGTKTIIKNSEISGNYIKDNPGYGAIYVQGENKDGSKSTLDITNTRFIENNSNVSGGTDHPGYGGAVFVGSIRNMPINVTNSYFEKNKARNGGAILTSEHYSGDLKIKNSIFKENEAVNGGALYPNGVGTVEITESQFIGNKATSQGGGAYLYPAYDDGTNTLIKDSLFENNNAELAGGGLFLVAGVDINGKIDIENSTFKNNSSNNFAGGVSIAALEKMPVNINKSTFDGNTSLWGGGINLYDSGNNEVTITDSIIKNNTAKIIGGGINLLALEDVVTRDDTDNVKYKQLQVSGTVFENNKAEKGFFILDGDKYPNIYSTYESNIKNNKSLSKPAVLGTNIAYNNYDIGFVSDEKILAVTFEPEGGVFEDNTKIAKVIGVKEGEKITSENITREGYTFEGWYLDKDGKEKFDFNTSITANTTLYAKWKKDSNPGGGGGTTPPTKRATAVLANGKKYTDVLTATVLANERDCPILLTDTNDITTETFNELKRRGIGDVIISGGPDSVSQKVVDQLKDFNVIRYAGSDRYGTAREIGKEV